MDQSKLKIAIYYHVFQRNDGGPLYYFNILKNKLKLNVTHLVPEGNISKFGKFDLHFLVDYGEDGLPTDKSWEIPKDGGTTIYVCSDAHIDDKGKKFRFDKARKFDYVFFNQKRAFNEYMGTKPSNGHHAYWLPHAAEPQAYPHFEIVKKYDVCFIGHYQDVKNYNGITRIDFLDRMFKEFPNFYFGTRNPAAPGINLFEDASKKFCQSKVVLNISIGDDISMRFHEAQMSGSLLLTNWIPTLKEYGEKWGLVENVHYVTYKTMDEAVEKAKYYIEHDTEREEIALRAYHQALKTGTYENRIREIFKIIQLPIE